MEIDFSADILLLIFSHSVLINSMSLTAFSGLGSESRFSINLVIVCE